MPLTVRPAIPDDAPAMTRVYNEGIRARTATFETRERTPDELMSWFERPRYPVLVAEADEGEKENCKEDLTEECILGWVAASSYRPRACYEGIAEFSVYVSRAHQRRGIGDALMRAFIPACGRAGLWKLVSRVFPENTASRGLCYRHGFREVGVYQKHARLEGVWRDVVIVERLIEENLTPS